MPDVPSGRGAGSALGVTRAQLPPGPPVLHPSSAHTCHCPTLSGRRFCQGTYCPEPSRPSPLGSRRRLQGGSCQMAVIPHQQGLRHLPGLFPPSPQACPSIFAHLGLQEAFPTQPEPGPGAQGSPQPRPIPAQISPVPSRSPGQSQPLRCTAPHGGPHFLAWASMDCLAPRPQRLQLCRQGSP